MVQNHSSCKRMDAGLVNAAQLSKRFSEFWSSTATVSTLVSRKAEGATAPLSRRLCRIYNKLFSRRLILIRTSLFSGVKTQRRVLAMRFIASLDLRRPRTLAVPRSTGSVSDQDGSDHGRKQTLRGYSTCSDADPNPRCKYAAEGNCCS